MIRKINLYIFIQICKSCALVLFIFLSIAWLLQLTRLFSLTNIIQIDLFSVVYLSFFLIPNLLSVIIPFIIIFGILLCFLKLNKDKELISIFSLGLQLKPIKVSLYLFSIILIFLYIFLNFYFAPKVYEVYKYKEFQFRNTIDFNRMINSNFLKLGNSTTLDFNKNNNIFEDIFINYFDDNENIIFAKKGIIKNENINYVFQLKDGFKLNILKNNEIEKLEFDNYILKIKNNNVSMFNNFDRNSFTIFDDLKNNNYLNISFKIFDVVITIFIIYIFYFNNLVNINFNLSNNFTFLFLSISMLIINQFLKNFETNYLVYIVYLIFLFFICLILIYTKKKYVQS